MTSDRVGTYRFVAEPFHVDFTGRLMLGVLGNHLLNCAGFHANERGFGMEALHEHHCTWVLSRLVVELEDLPRQYEEFAIQTWVENVYHLFTDRNFAILSGEGKPLGYARSVWAMIDKETRKPADLYAFCESGITDYACDRACPIDKPGHIRVSDRAVPVSYQVKYGDIDVNGHVNSIRYIEQILDLFPLKMYEEKRLRRFEMAYMAESRYGDTLDFCREEVGKDIYAIEVRKNGTEAVVRSKVIFV